MELPFHLKMLPPEALEILRFFEAAQKTMLHVNELTAGVDLSERVFGKAIRRLITKGYLQMDGGQVFRLSESGQSALRKLVEAEAQPQSAPRAGGRAAKAEDEARQFTRRALLVLPRQVVVGLPTEVTVAFPEAAAAHHEEVDLVLRLAVVNGKVAGDDNDMALTLDAGATLRHFEISAGHFRQIRVRLEVYQMGIRVDDVAASGGLYVDVDVVRDAGAADRKQVAYGADLTLYEWPSL